jgi:hypothetical protein
MTYPNSLDDDPAWIELFNRAWRERAVDQAERVGRMLMIKSPERSDFANALQRVRSQYGRLGFWPSPRITMCLAPNDGKTLLLKRWADALLLFRNDDITGAIPILRQIARAMPDEAPFAFGINLRGNAESARLFDGASPTDQVWNPIGEISEKPRPFTVLACGNQEYIDRYASGLLRSAASVSPCMNVHIHFCDPKSDAAQQIAEVQERYPSLEISGSWSLGRTMRRPVYFACARFLVVPHLLRRTRAPVLVVDIDASFKRDPMDYLSILEKADIGLSITEGSNHWHTVKAGLQWITPSEDGFRFANGLARYLDSALTSGECCWTLDQTALWATYRHFQSIRPNAELINLFQAKTETGQEFNLAADLVDQVSASSQRASARAKAKAPKS